MKLAAVLTWCLFVLLWAVFPVSGQVVPGRKSTDAEIPLRPAWSALYTIEGCSVTDDVEVKALEFIMPVGSSARRQFQMNALQDIEVIYFVLVPEGRASLPRVVIWASTDPRQLRDIGYRSPPLTRGERLYVEVEVDSKNVQPGVYDFHLGLVSPTDRPDSIPALPIRALIMPSEEKEFRHRLPNEDAIGAATDQEGS
jgi:hypothetical protein